MKTLEISNNKLDSIDHAVYSMKSLVTFNFANNPINKPILVNLPPEEVKREEEFKDMNTTERRIEEIYSNHDVDVDVRTKRSRFPSMEKIRRSLETFDGDIFKKKLDQIRRSNSSLSLSDEDRPLYDSPKNTNIRQTLINL